MYTYTPPPGVSGICGPITTTDNSSWLEKPWEPIFDKVVLLFSSLTALWIVFSGGNSLIPNSDATFRNHFCVPFHLEACKFCSCNRNQPKCGCCTVGLHCVWVWGSVGLTQTKGNKLKMIRVIGGYKLIWHYLTIQITNSQLVSTVTNRRLYGMQKWGVYGGVLQKWLAVDLTHNSSRYLWKFKKIPHCYTLQENVNHKTINLLQVGRRVSKARS